MFSRVACFQDSFTLCVLGQALPLKGGWRHRLLDKSGLFRGEGLGSHIQPLIQANIFTSMSLSPESYFTTLQKAVEKESDLFTYSKTLIQLLCGEYKHMAYV